MKSAPSHIIILTLLAFLSLGRADARTEDATFDLVGNLITVHSTIYLYGSGASADAPARIERAILAKWAKKPDGSAWTYRGDDGEIYNVAFDVNVKLYGGKPYADPTIIPDAWNPFSRLNYVQLTDNVKFRSFVHNWDEGKWAYPDNDCVFAHEFGHLLHLPDRYTDKHGANQGWKGNIMAEYDGKIEQRDIDRVVRDFMRIQFHLRKMSAETKF